MEKGSAQWPANCLFLDGRVVPTGPKGRTDGLHARKVARNGNIGIWEDGTGGACEMMHTRYLPVSTGLDL